MARPTISGTVVHDLMLYCGVNGSNKDYRIVVVFDAQGGGLFRVFTEYGPAGHLQNGSEQTKQAISRPQAESMLNSIKAAKLKKGYRVVMDDEKPTPAQAVSAAAVTTAQPPKRKRPAKRKPTIDSLPAAARANLPMMFYLSA